MVTEFKLSNPISSLNWKAKLDSQKGLLILSSEDGLYCWARKLEGNMPLDAFLVKKNVFLSWERPEQGHSRLQQFSVIHALDIFTGQMLWSWQDFILTVLPFEDCIFIVTYRNEVEKGFFIRARARNGQVLWKVASQMPIISWDINSKRIILKDSIGRTYLLNSHTGQPIITNQI